MNDSIKKIGYYNKNMLSRNIIIILVVIFIVGFGAYIYYQFNEDKDQFNEDTNKIESFSMSTDNTSKYTKGVMSSRTEEPICVLGDGPQRILKKKSIHTQNKSKSQSLSKRNLENKSNISDDNSPIVILSKKHSDLFSDRDDNDTYSPTEVELDDTMMPNDMHLMPSNYDQTDPNETWDESFGLPLMSKEEKKKFFNKMQQNHKKYEKSISEFAKHQTDRSTIIKTDTTIDPFKPDHRSKKLKGQTIKEIYDAQVAGPKAKPKKIKNRTSTTVVYENESELNGGLLSGTKELHGYDGINNSHKSADFGNEFYTNEFTKFDT
jgi:hypothetical protein